ncbi:MAG: hypothetical protein GX130_05445 [Candidatus Hydrogenedens sp.]|jgi:hypothetical protein|nr:hypothetical protein [Candidatus Hydrogenedens sp.]
MLNRITERELRLARWTAVVLLAAALYLFLIEPRILAWQELLEDQQNAADTYRKLSLLVQNDKIIRDRYALITPESDKDRETGGTASTRLYRALIPSKGDGDALRIKDIRPLGYHGVTGRGGGGRGAVIFGEGTMDALEGYLIYLVKSEETLHIEKFSMTIPRKDSDIQFSLTVIQTTGGAS